MLSKNTAHIVGLSLRNSFSFSIVVIQIDVTTLTDLYIIHKLKYLWSDLSLLSASDIKT